MGINRRVVTLITAAAIAIGVPLAAAPAANAATRLVYICHTTSVSANIGDTLVIFNDCPNDTYVDTPLPNAAVLSGLGNVAAIAPNGSWTATAAGLGTTSISLGEYGVGSLPSIRVSVVAQPVPAPVLEAHDYLQQVGVPASGKCTDVASPTGHWPGFPFGGWGKSWAQWINGGKGGPVCTREIEFNPYLGAYVLVS
jgi:hypothetical protein